MADRSEQQPAPQPGSAVRWRGLVSVQIEHVLTRFVHLAARLARGEVVVVAHGSGDEATGALLPGISVPHASAGSRGPPVSTVGRSRASSTTATTASTGVVALGRAVEAARSPRWPRPAASRLESSSAPGSHASGSPVRSAAASPTAARPIDVHERVAATATSAASDALLALQDVLFPPPAWQAEPGVLLWPLSSWIAAAGRYYDGVTDLLVDSDAVRPGVPTASPPTQHKREVGASTVGKCVHGVWPFGVVLCNATCACVACIDAPQESLTAQLDATAAHFDHLHLLQRAPTELPFEPRWRTWLSWFTRLNVAVGAIVPVPRATLATAPTGPAAVRTGKEVDGVVPYPHACVAVSSLWRLVFHAHGEEAVERARRAAIDVYVRLNDPVRATVDEGRVRERAAVAVLVLCLATAS